MNHLYVPDGAGFRLANTEEIVSTASRLMEHHYRCGEPVLDDREKRKPSYAYISDSNPTRCLGACI